jgi:acetyl esterase/lipase
MDEQPPHLNQAPPLDPAWLLHESSLPPAPAQVDIQTHKKNYIAACTTRNTSLLSGRDAHLTQNITITDVPFTSTSSSHPQVYRQYTPTISNDKGREREAKEVSVIYYHGGGLYVGDLDSEDLTCRRICLALGITVYSCHYRLMTEHTPDDSLSDAIALFEHLLSEKKGEFSLVGSSSGGQLAAQVSQHYARTSLQQHHAGEDDGDKDKGRIQGVLLRCPVTCNPSTPTSLPPKYQKLHTSLIHPSFTNSLISATCVDNERRTFKAPLPLEAEEEVVRKLPRHWVQLCTNDIFYSDGACYVDLLREKGVSVRTDVVAGWPHTFWLKFPQREYS